MVILSLSLSMYIPIYLQMKIPHSLEEDIRHLYIATCILFSMRV